MNRCILSLVIATILVLTLASAGAQKRLQGNLTLLVGAPIAGGVSSGGTLSVVGSLTSQGESRSEGGRFSLVSGVLPTMLANRGVYLPMIVR